MATQRKSAPLPAPAEVDEEEGISTVLLDNADWTPQQIEGMKAHLAGTAAPQGFNVACNGFFKKAEGAQIIGRVVETTTKQSDLNPDKEDVILFIQGIAEYPDDVKTKSGKAVVIKKGEYTGTFGYQIDAGSMALSSSARGTKMHAKVKEMIDLSGGRTRWTYDFIRTW